MTVDTAPSTITVKQIVTAEGKPLPATLTSNIWVGRAGVFSHPTEGNKIDAFTSGKAYFASLTQACDSAASEICILGWQVNWDALLAPGLRLYDVLLRAAQRGVNVYVMPWDDSNPVQTYDDQTKITLESINDHPKVGSKRVHVLISKSMATLNNAYFSHHQKQVVVDRKIAFVGGIDLAYGRYDDDTFDLKADKDGREVLNRYNGCIAQVLSLDPADRRLVDPDLMSGVADRYARMPYSKTNATEQAERIAAGGWQIPYAEGGVWNLATNRRIGIRNAASSSPSMESNKPDLVSLDPARQPRMPWQDVHSRIEGPAVSDLLRNFVNRWNASGGPRLAAAPKPGTYAKAGQAHIQVLRSAPAAMGQAEYKALASRDGVKVPVGTEDDIHRAMVQLIEKASHFIYIENQFFVSGFGRPSTGGDELSPAAQFINHYGGGDQNSTAKSVVGGADDESHFSLRRNGWKPTVNVDDSAIHKPPTNKICQALIQRISRAILDAKRPNFHVYITLPVHSEGSLAKAGIAVQVYWTMQTLVFGSNSLLNGIRRAIKARELLDKGETNYMRVVNNVDDTSYQSVSLDACFKYVTLLNLRNWTRLGDRYVTEQVYVHTKLLVVDDLYALFGSANVNDRSLLGERDSEIAVLVMDGDHTRADINGAGSQRPVRKFAHELRKNVWKKLFGISGNVRPATDLKSAIDAPGSPDSWRRIQAQALRNAAAYEAAFPFVPRNWSEFRTHTGGAVAASILPTWDPKATPPKGAQWREGNLTTPMPFQPEFWSSPSHTAKGVAQLDGIRGFFAALPIHWTENENVRFAFPTSLVADNGAGSSSNSSDPAVTRQTTGPAFGKIA